MSISPPVTNHNYANNSHLLTAGIFTDPDFDYESRVILGLAARGVSDIGLVLSTFEDIADGNADSWFAAWTRAASRLDAAGDAEESAGHLESARWAYLSASDADSRAIAFIDGMDDASALLPTYTLGRASWDSMIRISGGRFLDVAVPYESGSLPGYLFRPDTTGKARPTLVVTNGSDGSLSTLYGWVVDDALARDWNVFLYDGPGQQSMLFERGLPFRHDWEAVLTPVVDALAGRPDVDEERLIAYGVSQAGYWLPRALAFEKRFRAAAVDPGVVDVSSSWTAPLPPALIEMLDSGDKVGFNAAMSSVDGDAKLARTFAFRSRPYGTTNPFDTYTAVKKYALGDLTARITTPLLVTDPEGEQFWPGQSQRLFDALPGEKELAAFSARDGANLHCEPLARELVALRVLDFLQSHL